ncbi:MAG TPA: hypothetical protein VK545_23415 [Streptomyces sp.]|nr:hypothetical protein [Streptomyces sp.]
MTPGRRTGNHLAIAQANTGNADLRQADEITVTTRSPPNGNASGTHEGFVTVIPWRSGEGRPACSPVSS